MTVTIRPAPRELAELVCAMRDDWDRTEVDGAIQAAGLALADREQAKAWMRVATELIRIAGDPEGHPRALREACRNPLDARSRRAAPPLAYQQAREQLASRRPAQPADLSAASPSPTTDPEGISA